MSAILRQSSEACLHRLQLELEWQESCPVLATHRLNMSKHTCEMLKLDLVLERLCMGLFQPHHSNLQDTKGQSIPQSPSVFRVVLHTSSFAHPVLFKAPWWLASKPRVSTLSWVMQLLFSNRSFAAKTYQMFMMFMMMWSAQCLYLLNPTLVVGRVCCPCFRYVFDTEHYWAFLIVRVREHVKLVFLCLLIFEITPPWILSHIHGSIDAAWRCGIENPILFNSVFNSVAQQVFKVELLILLFSSCKSPEWKNDSAGRLLEKSWKSSIHSFWINSHILMNGTWEVSKTVHCHDIPLS